MTLTAGILLVMVVGLMVERRLMVRDFARERRDWTAERAALVNREPVRVSPLEPAQEFNVEPLDGPQADERYWESRN